MRERFRRAVVAMAAASVVTGVGALAQQAPPAQGQPAATAAKTKANLDEPVAIVNNRPVPKSELISLLAQVQIPPGSEQRAYESALDTLINTVLLRQFLDETARVTVAADALKRIEEEARAEAKKQGTSLEGYLADTGTSIEEFRDRIALEQKWRTYVNQRATDKELKDYVERNKDLLSGTQVRASHILVKVDAKASPEDKEKARQKLQAIRQEIVEKKLSFADAANKYSEDDGNVEQPSGGDLGRFPRRGIFIEPFSKAAFALKKDELSDVVETEYGLHLILVTDRTEGQAIDFERSRNAILNQYAGDLQSELVEEMRKSAQIEQMPMPKDLFQLLPREQPPAPGGASARPATAPTR